MARILDAVRYDLDLSGSSTAYIEGEDDAGPDSLIGWGRTPAAAIEDLLAQLQGIIVRVR